jgi:hypothetical protein
VREEVVLCPLNSSCMTSAVIEGVVLTDKESYFDYIAAAV